ncbi:MAG: CII family transcriptional regulator [Achromobacter sp.]|uniref:CII family transcriptional regulator n=1 Tax=Achromobacter sp. TaxID=134375 RepID=UPI0029B09B14|nr:CII family transcriptional regulator [Achromobacter sp.]MDX3986901.1 CII family transcriptional regulator [Achromobacter sp.]
MSIPEFSAAVSARARRIEQIILQRLASVGHAHAAACVGLDESAISRWKDKKTDGRPGEIERMALFLASLSLKATPQEYKCYDEATLAAMLTFAKQRMDQIQGVGHLAFEDDE